VANGAWYLASRVNLRTLLLVVAQLAEVFVLAPRCVFRKRVSAAIRICPLVATHKTPRLSRNVTGFAGRLAATLPLPNRDA
jgi:hypothetical protein